MPWAAWEGAVRCTGGPEAGARALLAWLLEAYPQGWSMGIYNCREVRGGKTRSLHSEGRAIDYGMPMVGGRGSPAGREIVNRLAPHGVRLGIQEVIYDRMIWSARSPGGRPYTGVAPHYDHLHIALCRPAARSLNLATCRAAVGSGVGASQPAPALSPPPYPGTVLKQGMTGNVAVRTWQSRMKERGWRITVSGDFDARTLEVVRAFQAEKKLGVDGLIGPKTWGAAWTVPVS